MPHLDELGQKILELEENVRILQLENDHLAERAEDTLLLGLIAEQISMAEDVGQVLEYGLERISVLKDVPFCACCLLTGNRATIVKSYLSFSDEDVSNSTFVFPETVLLKLAAGDCLLSRDECSKTGTSVKLKTGSFVPLSAICIPFRMRYTGANIFFFGDDKSEDRLSRVADMLHRVTEMMTSRIDNISLFQELQALNSELDRKVEERTLELQESENRFRQFFENVPAYCYMVSPDGLVLDVNKSALNVLCYGKKDIVGRPLQAIYAPECLPKMMKSFEKWKATGKLTNVEMVILSKGGERRTVLLSSDVVKDAEGDVIHSVSVQQDITERKRAEEALHLAHAELESRVKKRTSELSRTNEQLRQEISERKKAEKALRASEERFRMLFEVAGDAIYILDAEGEKAGQIVSANPVAAQMHGYTLEEFLTLKISHLDTPESARLAPERLERVLRGERVKEEVTHRTKDGTIFSLEITACLLELGGHKYALAADRDIGERKQAEKEREILRSQLFQAQKLEAIGTLTGGIAHDFNNLLTIMNGYTELILSEKTEDDPIYADLQKVLETGHKGAEMVQRLLAFSKKGDSNPQPLNLNLVVENSRKLIERTFPKMIEIETILEKDLGKVNADEAQVEQVLINLCINAKEAMPDGGKLRIETRNITADESSCRLHHEGKPGPHVLIEVLDTGVGMGAQTLGRIFDPFFTTKGWDFNKGTGLGLSVAKGIVEQHGGWITCESEEGKGTTFRLYFPVIKDSTVDQKPELLTETVPGGDKILLVDDEDLVRDLGKRILNKAGYTVITASNGREALEIFSREQSSIGLVVLDLIMPEMGGEKCLEELLRLNPHVKVVVSSGHSLDPKERDRLGAYAKGFVNKPYQVKRFVEVVRGALTAE